MKLHYSSTLQLPAIRSLTLQNNKSISNEALYEESRPLVNGFHLVTKGLPQSICELLHIPGSVTVVPDMGAEYVKADAKIWPFDSRLEDLGENSPAEFRNEENGSAVLLVFTVNTPLRD